ncbi:MAG: isoprenyl transferase [Clostridiales bacterium]|nr:isoprenyl transferase [Clostridiales bacterium]
MLFHKKQTGLPEVLPVHIGIIMDGNGRWAKKRGLPRFAGHKAGADTFKKIARYCNQIGIKYLTVYAFSTENWKRPQKEVEAIIELLRNYLRDAENYKKENIRVRFIGDISVFDEEIRTKIAESQSESKDFTGLNLNIAINYGGKDEIVHAARLLAEEAAQGKLRPEEIDESAVEARLYTNGQPNVDLVIRPSGEYRLSNFMVWQSAYAEFVFMNVLWPDFTEKHLNEALWKYANRNRRFGGL